MNEWLAYVVYAALACAGWLLVGYLARSSYDKITEGRR